MTGRHKFSDLEAGMAPDRRARIDQLADELGKRVELVQSALEPHLSQAVLRLLREHPDGLTPSQIREKLGLQDDGSCKQSISNALSALRKSNKISSRDRKFVPA